VVSVPTDSTDAQKAALTKAAADAHVQILQFIPEPVAAVLAYDARGTDSSADKIVVVADLGGLRSDVSVIASRGGMYSILATVHDYELGGAQLDAVLVDFFAKEFEKKNKVDAKKNEKGLAKLKLEAESVKKALSQSATATFTVESLADGIDFRSTINRTRYEIVAGKVFARFSRLVEDVIKKADLDVLDIDEVIMSGGTSHTPKIANNIAALFPESTTVHSPATVTGALNPSELSSRGAAIQASLIQDFDKEDIDQSTHEMVTITPHLREAIGVQVTGQSSSSFQIVIPPASAVPAKRTAVVKAPEGDVLIRICEGEREIRVTKPEIKSKTNGATVEDEKDEDEEDSEEEEEEDLREKLWKPKKTLAEFVLKGLKKGAKVEVAINVSADLGLSVTAREVGGKGGVRGSLAAPQTVENGKA
jgi:molecular chaperone DnaK (HSP70)